MLEATDRTVNVPSPNHRVDRVGFDGIRHASTPFRGSRWSARIKAFLLSRPGGWLMAFMTIGMLFAVVTIDREAWGGGDC